MNLRLAQAQLRRLSMGPKRLIPTTFSAGNYMKLQSSILLVFLALLFIAAMVWAKSVDPFVRKWFKVRTGSHGKVDCVAVLPKPVRPCPVVFYLHSSGGTLIADGKELRRLAELGMAVVSLDFDQTNYATFEDQFSALLDYMHRQPWALMQKAESANPQKNGEKFPDNPQLRMAWVGDGLGAQNELRFLLKHTQIQPDLVVMLGGGMVPELGQWNRKGNIEHKETKHLTADVTNDVSARRTENLKSVICHPQLDVLLVHGEDDEVFPVGDCKQVAAALSNYVAGTDVKELTSGPSNREGDGGEPKQNQRLLRLAPAEVNVKIIPGLGHTFEPNRALVFRLVGECIKRHLTPERPLPEFPYPPRYPFLICAMPAFLWAWWGVATRKRKDPKEKEQAGREPPNTPKEMPEAGSRFPGVVSIFRNLTWPKVGLGAVALVLATWAMTETAIRLVTPRLPISQRTLRIARNKLVIPKWHDDFETLAGGPPSAVQPIWKGQKLGTLLTHVALAHYCVYELINWKLPPQIYQDYVLSPVIEGGEMELNWRRPLWEFFYPRIRQKNTIEAAAEIVARTLRERVTICPDIDRPYGVETIWKEQITNEKGFERIYVATLRSVGIPARLDSAHKAEFWDDNNWRPAPRPILGSWSELFESRN